MYGSRLLLVLTALLSVRADGNQSDDDCPLWHYPHQGKCKCGNSLNGAILCSHGQIFLRVDHAMDVWYNMTVAALSRYAHYNYSAITSGSRIYSPIPEDVTQQELNDLLCRPNNRRGFLCNRCLPNYGPSAYSFKCHKCHYSLPAGIALYLITKLPTALIFFLIMLFHFNIIGGPLFGYICFCQIFVIVTRDNLIYLETILVQLGTYNYWLVKISISLSTVWSFDLTGIFPPFCISDKLQDFDVLLLNYVISGLSPFFLLVCSYILIELHARGVKAVVFCCKPFNTCLEKFDRNWRASDSIIHAFASLMFLSFIMLGFSAYELLCVTNIYSDVSNHALKTNVLLIYPTMDGYGPSYKCYIAVVLLLLFFLGILPSLILLLYPIKLFQTALQKCCLPSILLKFNIVVETFQGPFKDGCNGTRDFRMVPGLLACIALLISILSCVASIAHYRQYIASTLVAYFVLIAVLSAYARPFKSFSANVSLTFHFMWLVAVGGFFILWTQDFIMDTEVLSLVFLILMLVPHLCMLLWLCYKIVKKFSLQQRAVVCFSCLVGRQS